METFLQQTLNGLVSGSIYALVALGYTMVYGILGLINFAHGDLLMVGALVALQTVSLLNAAVPGLHPAILLIAGMAVAVPVCMAVGYLIERIAIAACATPPASLR